MKTDQCQRIPIRRRVWNSGLSCFKKACVRMLCVVGLTLFTVGPTGAGEVDEFTFSKQQRENRFIDVFQEWAASDAANLPVPDSVLCVGSSSMRMWKSIHEDLAPMKVIHRGFGGSTMEDVLVYGDFFARYPSRVIVVYEGDNDLMGACTPQQYVAQCHEFVAAMTASREDRIFYFLSVKPSISRWHKWDKFKRANTLLKAYCDRTKKLHYVDIATPMLNSEGTPRPELFLDDKLHMTAEGYAIWKNELLNVLPLGLRTGEN